MALSQTDWLRLAKPLHFAPVFSEFGYSFVPVTHGIVYYDNDHTSKMYVFIKRTIQGFGLEL